MPILRIYAILPTVTADWSRTRPDTDADDCLLMEDTDELLLEDGSLICLQAPEETETDGHLSSVSVDNSTGTTQQGIFLPEPLIQAALQSSMSRSITGHPLMLYHMPQVVHLTYPGYTAYEGFMRNNYGANRTDFCLVRGVQNEILIFVRDVDRKPVSLDSGDKVTIVITDTDTDRLLMERTLSVMDLQKGIYKLTTLPAEMDTWPTGPVKWSMNYTRAADAATVMLWTDQNYGVYSAAYVIASPYPGPSATTTLVWTDFSFNDVDTYYSAALPAAAKEGYVDGLQTFVMEMTDFVGTIGIEASTIAQPSDSDWFSVVDNTYTGILDQDIINVDGNFLWLRVGVSRSSGSLDQVQYKA